MPAPPNLGQIDHFIVLMLENRSFDHVLGLLTPPSLGGLSGSEFNLQDPADSASAKVGIQAPTSYEMPFDPPHEFPDVHAQVHGTGAGVAPMGGFIYAALHPSSGGAAPTPAVASRVLDCFQPAQLPILSTLASQFAIANAWYSSLPGPTWPNRFFVHAATSGGLTQSPTDFEVFRGYSFDAGTIYGRLDDAKIDWRIYHDGLPQTAGIQELRLEYVDPLTENFREFKYFASDAAAGRLPNYVFIEPRYAVGNHYAGGNSMHPLDDIRDGERLIQTVYNSLRSSGYWANAMLIITFDEHGGFFDHRLPPPAVPTGDDYRYAVPGQGFGFNSYGVRVPAVIVSAYTQAGTILDGLTNPNLVFDHASILATVESRFGLKPLTGRDKEANTLAAALNLADMRTDDVVLTGPAPDMPAPPAGVAGAAQAVPAAPISDNQQSFVALATAVLLSNASDPTQNAAIYAAHGNVQTQQQAADYVAQADSLITSQRG
jgi:phospholipase C